LKLTPGHKFKKPIAAVLASVGKNEKELEHKFGKPMAPGAPHGV
jgi:hypothetical protein